MGDSLLNILVINTFDMVIEEQLNKAIKRIITQEEKAAER